MEAYYMIAHDHAAKLEISGGGVSSLMSSKGTPTLWGITIITARLVKEEVSL